MKIPFNDSFYSKLIQQTLQSPERKQKLNAEHYSFSELTVEYFSFYQNFTTWDVFERYLETLIEELEKFAPIFVQNFY